MKIPKELVDAIADELNRIRAGLDGTESSKYLLEHVAEEIAGVFEQDRDFDSETFLNRGGFLPQQWGMV